MNTTCPNCGYCPHCGRSAAPPPVYPYWPSHPWYTPFWAVTPNSMPATPTYTTYGATANMPVTSTVVMAKLEGSTTGMM